MDIAAADGGLVCGFRLAPVEACDGDFQKLPGADESRPYWLHFSAADLRVRRWLEEGSGLSRAALEPERVYQRYVRPAAVARVA